MVPYTDFYLYTILTCFLFHPVKLLRDAHGEMEEKAEDTSQSGEF